MAKKMQIKGSELASRLFMLAVGIGVAVWLYIINLDTWEIPAVILVAGHDITKYALILLLIFIGALAGVFIKYGFRGGRMQLS